MDLQDFRPSHFWHVFRYHYPVWVPSALVILGIGMLL